MGGVHTKPGVFPLAVSENELTNMSTHFVDHHPEGIAIGLSCRSVSFRLGHPKPIWDQKFRAHPSSGPTANKRHQRVFRPECSDLRCPGEGSDAGYRRKAKIGNTGSSVLVD